MRAREWELIFDALWGYENTGLLSSQLQAFPVVWKSSVCVHEKEINCENLNSLLSTDAGLKKDGPKVRGQYESFRPVDGTVTCSSDKLALQM